MSPGPSAHPGPRAFWLGGGCKGGQLSEGRPSPTPSPTDPVPRALSAVALSDLRWRVEEGESEECRQGLFLNLCRP